MLPEFQTENLKERKHLEDLEKQRGQDIKMYLKEVCGRVWSGFIWLRTGKNYALSEDSNKFEVL
jgi:hypothetical protein